ncbi:unnamed protein product [Fusarium graminearum]|nr:unnamed protein product [Fusarium graminearum]
MTAQCVESNILKLRVWNSSLSVILTAYVERSYSGFEKPREIENENRCGIELPECGIVSRKVATEDGLGKVEGEIDRGFRSVVL